VDFGHQDHQTPLLSVGTSLKLSVAGIGQQTLGKVTKKTYEKHECLFITFLYLKKNRVNGSSLWIAFYTAHTV